MYNGGLQHAWISKISKGKFFIFYFITFENVINILFLFFYRDWTNFNFNGLDFKR
jgi:hypothetical protein